MSEEERFTEKEFHRKMAARLFNSVWDLMRMEGRTPEQNDRMIHSAHASRCHWQEAGDAKNWIIGEWQVSRVYALLKRQEPSLYHARRGWELCQQEKKEGFLPAYACEAMARAYSLTEDPAASEWVKRARQEGEKIAESEDRANLEKDLATIQIA